MGEKNTGYGKEIELERRGGGVMLIVKENMIIENNLMGEDKAEVLKIVKMRQNKEILQMHLSHLNQMHGSVKSKKGC